MTHQLTMNSPGQWKANSIGETARQAGEAVKPNLRWRCLAEIERRPSTAEMILESLRAEGVKTVLTSIRPRCSELARLGLIKDSTERKRAEGGKNAIVWMATDETERSLFRSQQALKAEKEGGE